MTLSFSEVEVPATVTTRTAEPNPFDGKFPLSEKDSDGNYPDKDSKALRVVVDGDKDSKAVKKAVSQARAAGIAVGRTARVVQEETTTGTGKNKKTQTALTIWTVKQIKRERKNKGAENGQGS